MVSGVGGTSSLDAATLQQMRDKMFSRLDADNDGTISQSEFDAGSPSKDAAAKADQMFAAFDTDGDGKLTKSELASGFEKMSSAMKSVLLGSQGAATTGDTGTDPMQDITLQLLDSLTSSDGTSATGLGASTQQSLLSSLLGLQEQGAQAG